MMDTGNKKISLIHLFASMVIIALVGAIMGFITHSGLSGLSLVGSVWLGVQQVLFGGLAHNFAWIVGVYIFKWPFGETFWKSWRQSLLGAVLTYFVFLGYHFEELGTFTGKIMLLGRVLGICLIVQIFLEQTGFYLRLYLSTHPDACRQQKYDRDGAQEQPEPVTPELLYLTREEEGVRELISPINISTIEVDDHYCLITYKREDSWAKWSIYERLKTLEDRYENTLVRINRSTLVNPKMVERVEAQKGKTLVFVQGPENSPFAISKSRKHLAKQLTPLIQSTVS